MTGKMCMIVTFLLPQHLGTQAVNQNLTALYTVKTEQNHLCHHPVKIVLEIMVAEMFQFF